MHDRSQLPDDLGPRRGPHAADLALADRGSSGAPESARSGDPETATGQMPAAVLWDALAADRRDRLARVVAGEFNEVSVGDLALAVEIDTPLAQSDHTRLLRAASLAIQYYRVEDGGRSERVFLKRFAVALQVDARDLEAYVLVLGREIRHREKTGHSPLNELPRLTHTEELAAFAHEEPLALPPAARTKHDPYEYVALAEEGLNNTEITKALGDVSEASVRRGLAAAGYERVVANRHFPREFEDYRVELREPDPENEPERE